ncbi:amino acid ABC transporter permease [Campylobacter upsaliensis]|uniref:Amino acid ABC transporter permease n=7 Tax=Campylobacter TaxID=194 RepID=A0A381DUB3_CAMUP|nr:MULTISPECIES: amino acid ABC transporter permease [Campylobacter]EAH5199099.1 amino acid ABC transporter permease [Campylobacter upsaliensis]EAH5217926.1 amino acid ABC transporter permease [Campylobacter upsaliensis]EAH5545751.1 amino acid ABC transporter permease [Campylobacter upsaliensis]EAH5675816.1 amino acid ABC transporter permease [Campylobacter upsaliensis]EAH5879220.1 amino acid ABC transporter permease [Campylobacter upsaliensis]
MNEVFNAQNINFLMQGLALTLKIALATCVISILFGTFLAITKNYGDRFSRFLASAYIDIFRNTPLLLWMLAACFVLPVFFGQFPQAFWGTIGFSLYTSSVMAEIIRGGLNSIPKGQFEAAYSQGFGKFFTLFYIILPQTFRRVVPSMLSQIITTIKDTAYLAGLGIAELTYKSKTILANLKSFEEILAIIGFVAGIYFVICFSLSMLVRYYAKKTAYAH